MNTFLVKTKWVEKASTLVVTSEYIPGLLAEAHTAQELEEQLGMMIPKLLEKNNTSTRH